MARILIWDLEISSLTLALQAYDLKPQLHRYHPDSIKQDWSILSAAWKWLGEKKIHVIAVSTPDVYDDEKIVRTLHKVLCTADILVGHNADAFDLKKFNTRAAFYNLSPIPKLQSIDTLKVARKHFRFTSNKLAYIAKFLGVGAKDESPDWSKVLGGSRSEIATMKRYNMKDVEVTEKVYLKLRPYMHDHPNIAIIDDVKDIQGNKVMVCPKCAGPNFVKNGFRYTQGAKYQKYFCNDCGGWFHGSINRIRGKIG